MFFDGPLPHCFHMSDVLHVCLSQTKMSAARTTAAASTSASTRSALTFVSAATVLYCMRTNMTVRKVGFTSIHTSTHTGTSPLGHTHTCCHIRTSMCSCTRTVIVPRTATPFSSPRPDGEPLQSHVFFIYSTFGGCRQSCPTGMCRKSLKQVYSLHFPDLQNPLCHSQSERSETTGLVLDLTRQGDSTASLSYIQKKTHSQIFWTRF